MMADVDPDFGITPILAFPVNSLLTSPIRKEAAR
jgi:hypothetical protein